MLPTLSKRQRISVKESICGRRQTQRLSVPEAGIEQTVKDSREGKYLRFQIRGKATFVLDGGGTSEISGVFVDPASKQSSQ